MFFASDEGRVGRAPAEFQGFDELAEILDVLAGGPRYFPGRSFPASFLRGRCTGRLKRRNVRFPLVVVVWSKGSESTLFAASERLNRAGVSHVAYEVAGEGGFVIVADALASTERALLDAMDELAELAGLTGGIGRLLGRAGTFPLPAAPPARPFVGSVRG
jgi:hypothetical protein